MRCGQFYNYITAVLELLMLLLVSFSRAQNQCPYDYSPCDCFQSELYGLSISCNLVPMTEIRDLFNQTPPIDITFSLDLFVLPNETYIPANLLGESRLTNFLGLYGPSTSLSVDPSAFDSSRDSLKLLTLKNIDTGLFNFTFLTDFERLTGLEFEAVTQLDKSLPTLPPLIALSTLYFYSGNTGLNEAILQNSSKLINGLDELVLYDYDLGGNMNEENVGRILDWVLPMSSETLKKLQIEYANMAQLPKQLGSFKRLDSLEVNNNRVAMIVSKVFIDSTIYPETQNFYAFLSSNIVRLDAGAFEGDYSDAMLMLNDNLLTRFDANVFQLALQQMANANRSGKVIVANNRFDCYNDPCHLGWLLQDNRKFLDFLVDAECYPDKVTFADLNPVMLLSSCPVKSAGRKRNDGVNLKYLTLMTLVIILLL